MIAVLSLSGCGGSSSPVSVAVTASAATVDATDAVTVTATLTNDSNSKGVTWTVSGGGALSNQAATGATYTAPAASSSALTVTVTATSVADTTKSGSTTITVPAAPAITTGALAAGAVGTAYSQTMVASGGIPPYSWTLTSGTLPACLTMNSAAVISGTPTASCAGTTNLTFKVTDSGTATALSATTPALGLIINAAPAITFTGTMPATATYESSSPYLGFATATGGAGALTYSVSSGSLPPGLILMSPSNGQIGGTPTAVGTFNFTIKAADAFGDSATQAYTITVSYPALKVTAATLPTGYVGSTYTQTTLAATGGSGAGYSFAVASGSSLPAGLNLSTAGVLSGKPTAQGTTNFTVTVTDSASNTGSGSFSITVNPAVSVTTGTTLPTGYVGASYSQTLAATGGSGTGYSWAVASGSTLPGGLSLSAAGVLSGTPTTAGTPSFTVTVTDSAQNTASATFTITIKAGVSITTGTTLPTGYVGASYSQTLAATGGSGTGYSWAVASGSSLPAGLTLSAAGVLSGKPTAAGTPSFAVTVTDSAQNTASGTFTVTISAALAITSPNPLPTAYAGLKYSQTLTAAGGSGTGYTWALASGQTLPPGLTFTAAGVFSGTPTTPNNTSIQVTVTDSSGNTATAILGVIIDSGVAITTGSTLPTGYVGSNYSQTLTATGGSGTGYAWTVASGSTLPGGLSLSAGGLLSGKPTTVSNLNFSVTVTDSVGNTITGTFSMAISPAVSINSITLPAGYAGTAYTPTTLTATGGTGTGYGWSWAAAGGSTLPAGLTLSSAGLISGNPTNSGTTGVVSNVVVTVTDSVGNTASTTLSVTIEASLTISTGATLPGGVVGTAYSQTLAVTGGSGGYGWATNSAGTTSLASVNLTLSPAGMVSGTPTANGTATFTATVTDSATHTANVTFTVTVSNALTITTSNSSLLPAYTGQVYSQLLAAAGGSGTGYTWTTTGSSNLSTFNLTLSGAGLLSGTPSTTGTASFTAQVKDSNSNTATQAISIPVYAPLALPAAGALAPATISQSYSAPISATGGSGSYSWTVTGLPSGLGYNSTGNPLTISGTAPSTTQTITLNVTVTDTNTSKSAGPIQYTIAVNPPTPLALPASGALPGATTNQVYSGGVNASGGSGSGYVFTVNGTPIPTDGSAFTISNGITVSNTGGNTLSIGGTPTTTGTVSLTNVTVKDSANDAAGPNTYTIAVTPPTPLALPLPSTNPLQSGTINQAYSGFINASGGSGQGYVFTVNGTQIPIDNTLTAIPSSDGLSATNTGGNTLSISGTPTAAATVTLNVTVTDSANDTASQFYIFSIVNPSAAYSVSGTVSYGGTKTGWIYLALSSNNCNNCGQSLGTAISTKGAFTINGVPTGTYTLQAWMDGLGYGVENASDPSTNLFPNVNVTVTTGNLTGVAVALGDPAAVTLSSAPTIGGISAFNGGAFVSLNGPLQNSNRVETPASYTVQWDTSSSFNGTGGSKSFTANGGNNPWIVAGIQNGGPYYFRVQGVAGSSTSSWSTTSSAVTIGAPTGGNTVSGTVTLPSSITPTGTLYTGFYDMSTGNIYATVIPSPSNSTPNAYSVQVPTGSSYYFFGLVDQTGNGLFGPGDISNTNESDMIPVAINPSVPSTLTQNLTLPGANALASVRTQSSQQTNLSGATSTGYGVDLRVDALYKLPVAVQLYSGPSYVVVPTDIATGAFNGNNDEFDYWPGTNGSTPSLSDVFTFNVTYSDSTPGTLTASPNAILSAFATNLSPTWNTSGVTTTPTFTWSYPANAANYTYQFLLEDSNYSTIWQIPGNNTKSNGFSSSITPSIAWGVDPTGGGSTPSVSSLTGNSTYEWQIQVTDANGNEALALVTFKTPEATLSLPAPGTQGSALVGTPYSQSLNATGGSGSGYIFTVNGNTVPASPSTLTLTDGLSATSNGNSLNVSGTPAAVQTISLSVSVTDSQSNSAGPVAYSIDVISGPSGVNNGSLSGTYACKSDGYNDGDGSRVATLSSLVADGKGGFSGSFDTNSRDDTTAQTGTLTGNYSIGADNNGVATSNWTLTSGATASGTNQYAIALTNATSPAQQFRMVETDDVGASPSGKHGTVNCYLAATSAFAVSTISGKSFALGMQGENGSGTPKAYVGRFSAGTESSTGGTGGTAGGSITNGYLDGMRADQTGDNGGAFTGSYTAPSSTTGRFTLAITPTGGGSATFAAYVIDANRMFLLETAGDSGLQAGDMRTQLNAPYSGTGITGSFVTYEQGYEYSSSSNSVTGYDSMIVQSTGNGTGVGTVNQIYQDENGTYQAGQGIGSTSTTTFDTSNPGRATMTVTGSTDTMIAYYFNTGSAFQLDFNASQGYLATGWTEPQSGTFTDTAVAGNYMLGQMPPMQASQSGNVGELALSSTGNITGGITTAGQGDFSWDQSISMSYAWDTTVTGTGSFLVGSGSKGLSCVVIGATKTACIINGDSSPAVMILQQ
jgi:hypothetical protein